MGDSDAVEHALLNIDHPSIKGKASAYSIDCCVTHCVAQQCAVELAVRGSGIPEVVRLASTRVCKRS